MAQGWKSVVIAACLLGLNAHTQANVQLDTTRVIFDAAKPHVDMVISNVDQAASSYQVKAWIDNGANNKQAAPFFITPPQINNFKSAYLLQQLKLAKLLPAASAESERQALRIIRKPLPGQLPIPQDRESVYFINVLPTPLERNSGATEKGSSKLNVLFNTRIKLFYRPHALKGIAANKAYTKLKFRRNANGTALQVDNPTPFHITFNSLKVGESEIKTSSMLPPLGSFSWPLPAGITGDKNRVTWQVITDQGYTSKPAYAQLGPASVRAPKL